ncbi:MAG: glutathione transferase [Sphingomonadaceae bacterium]
MELTLYVDSLFTSPWAMSVFVALKEKQLLFSLQTVDLGTGQNQLPAYRAVSLTARVPALVHGDFLLTESSAITEYLEEVFPAGQFAALYPQDVHERARARQLQGWIRSDLLPLRQQRDTETVFFGKACAPLDAAAQQAAQRLISVAEQLVRGPYLFEHWCVADLDLAIMLQRLILNGDPVPAALRDYAAAQWQRPSVQQWLAHHQPD